MLPIFLIISPHFLFSQSHCILHPSHQVLWLSLGRLSLLYVWPDVCFHVHVIPPFLHHIVHFRVSKLDSSSDQSVSCAMMFNTTQCVLGILNNSPVQRVQIFYYDVSLRNILRNSKDSSFIIFYLKSNQTLLMLKSFYDVRYIKKCWNAINCNPWFQSFLAS